MAVRRWLFLLPVLVGLAGLWQSRLIDRIPGVNGLRAFNSDLLPRWVGIRAAFRGEDPYSPAVLCEIQTEYYGRPLTPADRDVDRQGFWYPAYTAIVLGPFALLSWNAGRLAFFVIAPILFIPGVCLCIRALKPPSQLVWIATSLALVSWPVIWGFRQQQPTLLVAALIFLAYSLIVRGHDIPAGALLAISAIKPQLVASSILWLFLWAVLQRRYRLLTSFACVMIALLIPAEILVPNWFPHWIHSIAAYPDNTYSVLPLVAVLGRVPGLLATVVLVSVSAFALWRLRLADPQSSQFGFAFSLGLATALCVTPTQRLMMYNQMLLVPAAVVLFCWKPAGYYANVARCLAIGLFLSDFFVLLLAVVGESIFGPSSLWYGLPFQNYFLPVEAAVALLVQYWDVLQTTSSTQPVESATATA